MKNIIITILTIYLILISSLSANCEEIYMAIEKGKVLFMVDRNHWELAPNYLKLKVGDNLRILPGTIGKIFFSGGGEFHLPTNSSIQIEEDGISQVKGDEKVRVHYRDGLYESEVSYFKGDKLPDYEFPRLIETYPSQEELIKEKDEDDEGAIYLRSRLNSAYSSVLDEDFSKSSTRFSPFHENKNMIKPIGSTLDNFDRGLKESSNRIQLHKVSEEKLRERSKLELILKEAAVLQNTIDTKKKSGSLALDEVKEMNSLVRLGRSKKIMLEKLRHRENNLRKR